MKHFLAELQQRALVGDGAMGTLLYGRGVAVTQCLEALTVEQPAMIAGIHAEYVRAGAEVLTTHTFGANRMRLAFHGLQEQVRALNLAAVRLARAVCEEVGRDCFVAGNVGPVGQRVVWEEPGAREMVKATFREQITVLVEAGVDLLLLETFSDVVELELAVQVAREIGALPVVASMSYGTDGLTLAGQAVASVTLRLVAAGVDVVGTNCSVGPEQMVATLRVMREAAPDALLSVSPNAGLPVVGVDGGLSYPVGPAEFAEYSAKFVAMGARLVGGCCGTTPEYTRVMRNVCDDAERREMPTA